jgi:hypothetical protein
MIVVPQQSGGWQSNCSTETRQAGHDSDSYVYFLLKLTIEI